MMGNDKGAMMILVLITVLLLSIITIGGLTLSTSDIHITQNYYFDRLSYYTAVGGINRGIVEIAQASDPLSILINEKDSSTKLETQYYTGTIEDYNGGDVSPESVGIFTSINPPPPPGISLDANIQPIIWDLLITGVVRTGNKIAFSEIETGVYTLINKSY